jgi:hypothetical protein
MSLMQLAPLDYVFTGNNPCPVTFAFSYEQRLDPKQLERSLQQLLQYIPWLGGQLRHVSLDTLAYEVNGPPRVSLQVTSSVHTFEELSDSELVPLVKSTDGERLMHARLTQTPEGSVLGVSMSHALTDGFSFFLAMRLWAALARGERVQAPPLQRFLRPSEEQVAAALDGLDAQALLENTGLFWGEARKPLAALPTQERIHLSSEAVADMIADAQRQVDQKVRENDVLSAWLWRSYGSQLWSGDGNPFVYMTCPTDVRRQLGDGNQEAFGCTINFATARATHRELLLAPLGQLALRVQQSVKRVFASDHTQPAAALEAARRLHGVSAPHSVHLRHPQHGMLMTNMSRLPLTPLDFGRGAPTTLRNLSELDTMGAVLPAHDGVTISVYTRADASVSDMPRTAAGRLALRAARERVARQRQQRIEL